MKADADRHGVRAQILHAERKRETLWPYAKALLGTIGPGPVSGIVIQNHFHRVRA